MQFGPVQRSGFRLGWWCLGAIGVLAAMLAVFESTSWDLVLQDRFFDFTTQTWLVDRREPVGRWLFYDGPKDVIYALGFALLALIVGPASWRRRFGFSRRNLGVAFLTLLLVPLTIGKLKDVTDVYCPRHIRRYGGEVPYVRVFEHYPPNDRPAKPGLCFPAGHASGGFALLGLLWLRRSRAWRIGAITLAMVTGWAMGGYQMVNGSHYLSHTLTTMLLAIIGTLLVRLAIRETEVTPEAAAAPASSLT